MGSWISMADACSQLGVRPQTIYAYVSRGKLEVMPDPADTRRSLYRAEDVAGLAKRIVPTLNAVSIGLPQDIEAVLPALTQ